MNSIKATIPALVAALVVFSAPALQAEPAPEKRTISVSGTGIVHARPDTANLSIGVSSEARSAGEALNLNTSAMERVIADLKALGIAQKDIQTTNFSVNPRQQHFKDGKPPVITGYRVVNAVTIVVRDLGKLGDILDRAVSKGSNQINGIRFSIDDPEKLEDQARRLAMKDARSKADIYAESGDVKVGDILTISESTISRPIPFGRTVAMEARARPVPIEAGEQQVSATVSVTWEIAE